MLETAGFRVLKVRYWNGLLLPLMIVRRKSSPGHRIARMSRFSAMAGPDAAWHDGTRTAPAFPSRRRIRPGDRGAAMNDSLDVTQTLSVQRFEPGIGLSIVVPVYRGAATVATLVAELSRLRPRRAGDHPGQRRQPG